MSCNSLNTVHWGHQEHWQPQKQEEWLESSASLGSGLVWLKKMETLIRLLWAIPTEIWFTGRKKRKRERCSTKTSLTWSRRGKWGWLSWRRWSSRTGQRRCAAACFCEETTHRAEERAEPAAHRRTPKQSGSAGSWEPRGEASLTAGGTGEHYSFNMYVVLSVFKQRTHLSQKLRGEFRRLTGCLFGEQGEWLNQRSQGFLDRVCES